MYEPLFVVKQSAIKDTQIKDTYKNFVQRVLQETVLWALPFSTYENGCAIDGQKINNCTAACANQSIVFGSLEALSNCINAPAIAASLSGIYSNFTSPAERLGIDAESLLNSTYPSAIAKCMSSACNSSAGARHPTAQTCNWLIRALMAFPY